MEDFIYVIIIITALLTGISSIFLILTFIIENRICYGITAVLIILTVASYTTSIVCGMAITMYGL